MSGSGELTVVSVHAIGKTRVPKFDSDTLSLNDFLLHLWGYRNRVAIEVLLQRNSPEFENSGYDVYVGH